MYETACWVNELILGYQKKPLFFPEGIALQDSVQYNDWQLWVLDKTSGGWCNIPPLLHFLWFLFCLLPSISHSSVLFASLSSPLMSPLLSSYISSPHLLYLLTSCFSSLMYPILSFPLLSPRFLVPAAPIPLPPQAQFALASHHRT